MKFYNLLLLLPIASGLAMEMDHHHPSADDLNNNDMIDSSHSHQSISTPTSQDSSTESPIPHVMKHQHGIPILQTNLLPIEKQFWDNYNTTTYFTVETNHRPSLYLHIITGLFSIFIIYPFVLMFNNLRMRKTHFITLLIHTGCICFSLFNYSIFIKSIPDLYPHNAYNKMTIILFVSTILQLISYLFKSIDPNDNNIQFNNDYLSLSNSSSSSNLNDDYKLSSSSSSSPGFINKFHQFRKYISTTKVHKLNVILYNFLNWGHFFYFIILVPTAVATFCLYGQGKTVFNLLAHFIKGGVFLSYGILSLARYSGGFQNKGWSWNHKFINKLHYQSQWFKFQNNGLWTMEMIESSLILFYGSTNIFLEHLANAGGEWSPKDLQHVSIAFIFIGCGLCGVITELKLNNWRYEQALNNLSKIDDTANTSNIIKASPGFSPNPFPILTIYWTGILMSKHEQASQLSTDIHIQWGNLFILGCCFRFLTYMLMLLNQNLNKNLTQPTRPITELIVSFALICGGLIFMESTDPVILSLEYYGLTPMFTLNISLGLVTLFMSWEMSLFAIKDYLKEKYQKVSQPSVSSSVPSPNLSSTPDESPLSPTSSSLAQV